MAINVMNIHCRYPVGTTPNAYGVLSARAVTAAGKQAGTRREQYKHQKPKPDDEKTLDANDNATPQVLTRELDLRVYEDTEHFSVQILNTKDNTVIRTLNEQDLQQLAEQLPSKVGVLINKFV